MAVPTGFTNDPNVLDLTAIQYSRALQIAAQGHALWDPSAIDERGGVEGDCGYFDGGRFQALFSVYEPPDALEIAAIPRPQGRDRIIDEIHNQNDIIRSSDSYSVHVAADLQLPPLPQLPLLTVELSARHAEEEETAAFLAFCGPKRTVHRDPRTRRFENYLIEHGDAIVDYYGQDYPVGVNNLVIIYQTTRCISWWSGISYRRSTSTHSRLGAQFSGVGAAAQLEVAHSQNRPWLTKRGPEVWNEETKTGYSVVLRTVAMKKRSVGARVVQAVRAAAGHKSGNKLNTWMSKWRFAPAETAGSDLPGPPLHANTPESTSDNASTSYSEDSEAEVIAEQYDLLNEALEAVLRDNPNIDVVVGTWDAVLQLDDSAGDTGRSSALTFDDISVQSPGGHVIARLVDSDRDQVQPHSPQKKEVVAAQIEHNPFRRYQQTQQEAVAASNSSTAHNVEWKVAVAAYKRADDAQATLPALKQRLKDAQARLDQDEATLHALRDKNKSTYDELHSTPKESGKKSIIPKPWKSSSNKKNLVDENQQLPRQDTSYASFLAEANALHVVDTSRGLRDDLQAQLAGRIAASASLSAAFEAVRDAAVLLFPPSVVAASSQLKGAAQLVLEEDDAVEQAHHLATDMAKACQDAQMSHWHLREVLNTTDAAHESERRATGSFGPMGQVDVHNKYQKALKLAVVTQEKLDSCLQCLRDNRVRIPGDVEPFVKNLQADGVSQVQRMFALRYGESSLPKTTREKQLDALYSAQKNAFADLTKVAVWLQNYVPVLEMAQDAAAERRRLARRRLVELWEAALRTQEAQRLSWAGNSGDSHMNMRDSPSNISTLSYFTMYSLGAAASASTCPSECDVDVENQCSPVV